jgi:hypothetical protein
LVFILKSGIIYADHFSVNRSGPEGYKLPLSVVPPGFYAARDRWLSPEVLLNGASQAFWIAARRWTMRAVEAGLLNVECLKVH